MAERLRFSVSQLWETVAGLRLLSRPDRSAAHDRWTGWARERLVRLDREPRFRLLRWLVTTASTVPEFLIVTPGLRTVPVETELAAVVSTPAGRVRDSITGTFGDGKLPPDVLRIVEHPEESAAALAEVLAECHKLIIDPIWPRLAGVLEGDVEWRGKQLVEFGLPHVAPRLHDSVRWRSGSLVIGDPEQAETLSAHDRDVVLIPSAFLWPDVYLRYTPHRIALCYPARGFGSLWQRTAVASDRSLEAVIGRTRARLLRTLDRPWTVSELASLLTITSGAVSQHLSALRAAGLVVSRRSGKEVTSLRTALGHALVDGQLPESSF
ncbi:ArsR/SmtB family transcription factor [Lentzea xinjiangensis]|uniref:ArsR/SmtB family transcription factor n=1 Tax=Lentzea xinjiangensis TaxID=402600 RepID=UPI0015A5300D|nr:DUF5937 family protein [Lentzea xinjiangensis]